MSKRKVNLEVLYAREAPIVDGPEEAAKALREVFAELPSMQEAFVVLMLNARGKPTRARVVSLGTLSASLVHPREVFAPAILFRAAQIIVAHNHPSGNLSASDEDLSFTAKLIDAGQLLGIPVVDSLILTEDGRVRSLVHQ